MKKQEVICTSYINAYHRINVHTVLRFLSVRVENMAIQNPYTNHHFHPVGTSCLEKHPDDGHHGQTAVCQLCIKLGFLHLWVIRCDELPSKVSSKGCGSRRLVLGNFAESHVCRDLSPASCWHFGDCCKSIGNICKLQTGRWRQEAREFCCCCCCFRRLDWLSRQKIAKFYRGTVFQLKQPAFTTARCTIATLRIGHWHMNAEYDTVK